MQEARSRLRSQAIPGTYTRLAAIAAATVVTASAAMAPVVALAVGQTVGSGRSVNDAAPPRLQLFMLDDFMARVSTRAGACAEDLLSRVHTSAGKQSQDFWARVTTEVSNQAGASAEDFWSHPIPQVSNEEEHRNGSD